MATGAQLDKQLMGTEPVFDLNRELTTGEVTKAYNWYNYMYGKDEARAYMIAYYTAQKNEQALAAAKKTKYPSTTTGWIARLLMRGFKLPETTLTFFVKMTDELIQSVEKVEEEIAEDEKKNTYRPSVQEAINAKVSALASEINGHYDDCNWSFSLYEDLQKKSFPALLAAKIANRFQGMADELEAVLYKKDGELLEAYKGYTKKELQDRIAFWKMIVDDADRYRSNIVKARPVKERKKREVPIEKKLKTFKYQQESKEFKVSSTNPGKAIGAQEVWLFNTAYKTITVLRAINSNGIDIKGTTFCNYDEKNSMTKLFGRKTEEHLKRILTGGKIVLKKIMDENNNNPVKVQDRSGDKTIILRVL